MADAHDGLPGHGGLDPDQTLLVTADDETWSRMGTVTSAAEPWLLAVPTLGYVVPPIVAARPVPLPSAPCQKQ